MSPHEIKRRPRDKEAVLDIKAKDGSGRLYDVEVQTEGDSTFKARSLYYWARLYSDQVESGESYRKLMPTVYIGVVDFPLFGTTEQSHLTFLFILISLNFRGVGFIATLPLCGRGKGEEVHYRAKTSEWQSSRPPPAFFVRVGLKDCFCGSKGARVVKIFWKEEAVVLEERRGCFFFEILRKEQIPVRSLKEASAERMER